MRTFVIGVLLFGLLCGGIVAGWWAMNEFGAGDVGTPAHAGAVSNGKPEQCTNLNFQVKAREQVTKTVSLEPGQLLRGTFEVQGGFGRVDIFMRIVSPQGLELHATPRVENYDITLPVQVRGDYAFEFDNRFSMFTAKAVGFFYCIDGAGIPE